MGDHLALLVNRLLTESTLQAAIESRNKLKHMDEDGEIEFLAPKMDVGDYSSSKKLVECRICQDEDFDSNMEIPCSCRGSLKYAHRRCVQRWCNEKGDTLCEICHQPFKPGYTAPPPLLGYRHIPINVRRNWLISRRDLNEQRYIETVSVDEEDDQSSSRTSIFRFAVAVVFIGLLILRHTLPILVGSDEFVLSLFILAALRIAGILLLVYVTMRVVTGLRRDRHQQICNEIERSAESDASYTSSDDETEQHEQPPPSHSHVVQIS